MPQVRVLEMIAVTIPKMTTMTRATVMKTDKPPEVGVVACKLEVPAKAVDEAVVSRAVVVTRPAITTAVEKVAVVQRLQLTFQAHS